MRNRRAPDTHALLCAETSGAELVRELLQAVKGISLGGIALLGREGEDFVSQNDVASGLLSGLLQCTVTYSEPFCLISSGNFSIHKSPFLNRNFLDG